MKFKLDENLPGVGTDIFRREGFEADSVLDEQLEGASDGTLAQVCITEGRILITLDVDFANILQYPPRDYPGLIVLRPTRQDKNSVMALLPRIVELLKTEPINGCLWIVDDTRTRIRGGA